MLKSVIDFPHAEIGVYQSVSTASYWAFYSGGKLVRAIEAGDGELFSQLGERLPFETANPGHDIGDEGVSLFFFDHEDQTRYNRGVGVPVCVYEEFGPMWYNLEIVKGL